MAQGMDLWRESRPWRWTFSFTLLLTALCVFGGPWGITPPLAPTQYRPRPLPPRIVATPFALSGNPYAASAATHANAPSRSVQSDPGFGSSLVHLSGSYPPGTELHVVGVYGPGQSNDLNKWISECRPISGGDGLEMMRCQKDYSAAHPELRTITVDVQRTGAPIVLALMAYEATIWRVSVAPGVDLRRVIVSGYSGQDIQGVSATVPVEVHSYESSSCANCERQSGYFYGFQPGTREYDNALSQLHVITGLPPTSFQGAHQSSRFTINNWQAGEHSQPKVEVNEAQLGSHFRNQLQLQGQMVLLPDGDWETIAVDHTTNVQGIKDVRVLKRMTGGSLAEILGVRLQTNARHNGFGPYAACFQRADYGSTLPIDAALARKGCHWLSHREGPWEQPIYRQAADRLNASGIAVPAAALSTGFYQQGQNFELTTQYYSFPDEAKDSLLPWSAHPWNPAQLKPDSVERKWIDDRLAWAKNWEVLFKASISASM